MKIINSKRTSKPKPKKAGSPEKRLRWITYLVFIALAGIFSFLFFPKNQDENRASNTSLSLRAIGPESAPITITEYADFGCITCQAWHQFGVRDQIINRYGEQVRFIWHDFPVTSSQSLKAAEAGFCAHDQDRFWEYHNVLFENAPALAVANLKVYAESIGLNTTAFTQCLDSGKYEQAVESELSMARELGLRGVPSFIVNGKRLIGPPSFEQLSATIEEILQTQEE